MYKLIVEFTDLSHSIGAKPLTLYNDKNKTINKWIRNAMVRL
jgi:hypothetical protein